MDAATEDDEPVKATEVRTSGLPAESETTQSWGVTATTDDGKRWVNGVHFTTKAESCHYLLQCGISELGKLWPEAVTEMRIFESSEKPLGFVFELDRKGRMKWALHFPHGTCGAFEWRETDAAAAA